MKIETLKKDNKKKWIIGSIITIILIITITFIGTRAKFKTTGSIPIAKGTIKYTGYDMELLAVKLQNDEGTYNSSDNIPTRGYILNEEKSICKVEGKKLDTTITYENGKINILGLSKKGTKCEIYFDKFYSKDLILSNNTIDTSRATGPFNEAYNVDTAGKIFSAEDDDGDTYFFAGSNPNNWVQFGTNKEGKELYWRIIRVNGDNSIRLIYNGLTTGQEGTTIGTSPFNPTGDNAYVGYMYGTPGSTTYDETHANINDSTIKDFVDTWYEENLKTNYSKYLDTNAGFCGDRTINNYSDGYTGNGTGITKTEYASYSRTNRTYTPTHKCPNPTKDLYTLTTSIKGNRALTCPIGLITVDEVYYAGSYNYSAENWLKITGKPNFYWTMSPGSDMTNRYINYLGGLDAYTYDGSLGVRPVINLKDDTLTTGIGTITDPYRMS